MPIDMNRINEFLNEFLPYIAKQKMQMDQQRKLMEMYLERELGVMKGRAGYEEEKQARTYKYDTMLKFLSSILGGTEGLDRPGMAGRMRAGELGIPLDLPEILPEQYGEAIKPYTEMTMDQAGALEAGKYLPVEKMGIAAQLKGSEYAMDVLKEIEKTKAGREERGRKAEELEETRKKRELEERKFRLEKEGKKTPKEAKKELEKEEKRAFSLREKITKPPEATTPEQLKLWKSELAMVEEKINNLRPQAGEKTDEEYKAMAAFLNKEGFRIADVDTNKDIRRWLTEQGYSLVKLRTFFLRGK